MAQSKLWHEERKTQNCTEYYIAVVDGEQVIDFILKYDASKKEVIAEPYKPADYDYTVHDGCDHEDGYCVLEDPTSDEFEEYESMPRWHRHAVQNLLALEEQVKQQRIAERLNIGGMSDVDIDIRNAVQTLIDSGQEASVQAVQELLRESFKARNIDPVPAEWIEPILSEPGGPWPEEQES